MAIAARITEDELKTIFRPVGNQDLSTPIRLAHIEINEVVAPEAGVSAETLKDLELLMAAHYATLVAPQAQSFSTEGISTTHERRVQRGSRYLDEAIAKDPTGNLAR